MNPRCVPVTATLSARGEGALTERQRSHIETCFTCRSERSSHRALAHAMGDLGPEAYRAPTEVLPGVLDRIGPWAVESGDGDERNLHLVAAAAVATAATAAAAGTAVLVKLYRHRAA